MISFEIKDIVALIHKTVSCGNFTNKDEVNSWLDSLSPLGEEILQMIAFDYWDKGYGEGYSEASYESTKNCNINERKL